MEGDHVLALTSGLPVMYVWHAASVISPGTHCRPTCIAASVTVQLKQRFPHYAFAYAHRAMGSIVVMNRCALTRPPAEHQQFTCSLRKTRCRA